VRVCMCVAYVCACIHGTYMCQLTGGSDGSWVTPTTLTALHGILRGTAAGGDEGGAEEQTAVDEDANNSNVADKSSKPTSPGQSRHADDTAATDTSVAGEYAVR